MLSDHFHTPDRELEALYHLLRDGTKYDWHRRSHTLRDQLLEHGVVEEVMDDQGRIQEARLTERARRKKFNLLLHGGTKTVGLTKLI